MDPGKGNGIGMTKVPDFEQRQSVPVEGEDQDRLDLPPPYEATASTPASTAAPAVTPPGSSSPAGSVRGEDAAFLPQERGYQRTSPMSVGGSKDEERWEAMRGEPGCCFSDGAGCCFSDTEGCCFSDSKGCCFSSGEAACCSSGPRR